MSERANGGVITGKPFIFLSDGCEYLMPKPGVEVIVDSKAKPSPALLPGEPPADFED